MSSNEAVSKRSIFLLQTYTLNKMEPSLLL